MYFAHEEIEVKIGFWDSVGNAFQHPGVAIPVVTLIAIAIMVGGYWFLKRYTSWHFQVNNKREKK